MTTLKKWLKEHYEDYIAMREIVVAEHGSGQLAVRFDAKAAMCEHVINKLNTATFDDYAVLDVGDVIIRGGTHQQASEHDASSSSSTNTPEGKTAGITDVC